MQTTVTYAVLPINEVPADLMDGLNAGTNLFAVVRTSTFHGRTQDRTNRNVWLLSPTFKAATAACRRYRARDVVTR